MIPFSGFLALVDSDRETATVAAEGLHTQLVAIRRRRDADVQSYELTFTAGHELRPRVTPYGGLSQSVQSRDKSRRSFGSSSNAMWSSSHFFFF